METAYLRTFLLVVQTGSMAEAARKLEVTPAAVAHQMRLLDRDLGVKLLVRVGRTVVPSEAGHRLATQAQRIMDDLGGLRRAVRDDAQAGELRLGAINTALHSVMPEVLAGFVRVHPQARVEIRSALSSQLYDAVVAGDLDAAVCLHPPHELPKPVQWAPLFDEALVVMAPSRLAHADPLSLLRSEPFIQFDPSLGGGKQAVVYLQERGITPQVRFRVSSLPSIAMLVDRGLGVSLAPNASIPLWKGLRVAKLPLSDSTYQRRVGILWMRSAARAGAVKVLVEQAQKALRIRREE